MDADEPLFEVSTDKVDSEVPAPSSGVLSEIVVPEGDTVPVGARLAVIGDGSGAAAPAPAPAAEAPAPARRDTSATGAAAAAAFTAPAAAPGAGVARSTATTPAPVASAPAPSNGGGTVTSPIVRQLIAEEGLDPNADPRQR